MTGSTVAKKNSGRGIGGDGRFVTTGVVQESELTNLSTQIKLGVQKHGLS